MGGIYNWRTPKGDATYMEHNGTFHCHCATAVTFCAGIVGHMIMDGRLKRREKLPQYGGAAKESAT